VTDTAVGYLILGIGMAVVLGVVFVIAARSGGSGERPSPPRGVHLPPPSFLPVVIAVGGSLLAAAFVFHPEGQVANLWLLVPGLIVFVGAVIGWIRAANREWREVEHGSHDDGHATH
jgi:hypothetical protein